MVLSWTPLNFENLGPSLTHLLILLSTTEHTYTVAGVKQCQSANSHAQALAKRNKCYLETKETNGDISHLLNKPLVWWQKLHI